MSAAGTRVDAPSEREHPAVPARPAGGAPAGPGSGRSGWRRPTAVAVPVVAGAVGLALLARADSAAIGPFGLVTVLTPWVMVPVAVLAAGFVATLRRTPGRSVVLACYLTAWTVLLHGAPSVVEAQARFPVAWLHVGFVDQVLRHGQFLPGVDARFNWPGFFAAAAGFTAAAGISPLSLLRWAPVVIELAVCLPLAVLLRGLGLPRVATWVAVWVFVTWDWVGQDYFSPQALGTYLLLTIAAAVVRWLPRRPWSWRRQGARHAATAWGGRLPALPQWPPGGTGSTGAAALGSGQRVALVVCLLGMSTALVMTHQLSPVVLVALLAVLVVAGWRPVALPAYLALAVLAWLTWMAAPFWTGHFGAVFGALGRIGQVVQEGVVGRFHGDASRRVVLVVRMALASSGLLLACLGALRVWRTHRGVPWVLAGLAIAPFALVGVQSYGGEVFLRVVMYSLPAVAGLAAMAFAPRGTLSRRGAVAFTAVVIGVVPAFGVARYGNEAFEQVRTGEVTAVRGLYSVAQPGATIAAVTPLLPWRFQGYANYDYRMPDLSVFADLSVPTMVEALPRNPRGTFLVVTRGQEAQAEIFYGLGPGWGDRLERTLDHSPWFRVVYRNPDAVVYQLQPPPAARATGQSTPTGGR